VRLLMTDPRLAVSVYFGLTTPAQYRLVGPGSWRGARDAILSSRGRMLQPLNTRPTRVDRDTTSDSRRRSLLLPTVIIGAVAATAWSLYQQHRAHWN